MDDINVLLGAVVDQQLQTYLTKLLGCFQQCHCSGGCMWHPESHGGARRRLGKVVHATHGLRDTKGYEDG